MVEKDKNMVDHKDGCIFFTSGRREKQIQQMAQEVEKLARTNGGK